MKRISWAILAAVAMAAAGCSDPVAPTTPTPDVPTISDTFSDILLVGGANKHDFLVRSVGGIKVTLSEVTPGAIVGLGIGFPGSLGTCTLLDHVESVASTTVQMSGTATLPGNLCVEIFDIGNLVEPATYTITVLHS